MDIRKVKKLIELLEESGIAEIEIHEGEESVRISRGSTATPQQTVVSVPQPAPVQHSSEPVQSQVSVERTEPDVSNATSAHTINSPMVGIFYTSPSPEAPPFISKGQSVKSGDVICIIEAMKIMNQIESDTDGKIVRVLVENGEAVEYGQALFEVEPS